MVLEIITNKQNLIINLPKLEATLVNEVGVKALSLSKSTFSLVSSNTSSSLTKRIRSEEEYQAIAKEMNFKMLTIEDMVWIDLNITEDPSVPS